MLLLLPCFAFTQPIALLDRAFKKPVTVTKALSTTQLSGRQFPIYTADLDTVIQVTEQLARYIDTGAVRPPDMQMLAAGHSLFAVTTNQAGVYNNYTVFLSTRSGNLGATLELVKHGYGNRKAVQQLRLFLDYLKNNRHIAAAEK